MRCGCQETVPKTSHRYFLLDGSRLGDLLLGVFDHVVNGFVINTDLGKGRTFGEGYIRHLCFFFSIEI